MSAQLQLLASTSLGAGIALVTLAAVVWVALWAQPTGKAYPRAVPELLESLADTVTSRIPVRVWQAMRAGSIVAVSWSPRC